MYGHEVETKKDGDKEVYNISLFNRFYFMRKKLIVVVTDINNLEDAKKLCGMLDSSLKAGMMLAKGVK